MVEWGMHVYRGRRIGKGFSYIVWKVLIESSGKAHGKRRGVGDADG